MADSYLTQFDAMAFRVADLPHELAVSKIRAFLEEESVKTDIPYDVMLARLHERGMIDTQTRNRLAK